MKTKLLLILALFACLHGIAIEDRLASAALPHIILVMADDMGWGQTGYRDHTILKTPNLDAMAANGLRFERFYAGGPVCSPTRASMLTGRTHDRAGGLRGNKGSVFEGGLRVPGIIEWPAVIRPRVTHFPACVMDIFPTVAEIVGLPERCMTKPVDGISLRPLFTQEIAQRRAPMGFRYRSKLALIDDRYKLLTEGINTGKFQLYDLIADPKESRDLSDEQPEVFSRMKQQLLDWNASVDDSFAGKNYPEGKISSPDSEPVNWFELPQYQPFLAQWKQRWEYRSYLSRKTRQGAIE